MRIKGTAAAPGIFARERATKRSIERKARNERVRIRRRHRRHRRQHPARVHDHRPPDIDTTEGWRALAERFGFVLSTVQFAVPLKFTAELKKS